MRVHCTVCGIGRRDRTPVEGEATLNAADLVVAAQQVELVRREQLLREEVGDHLDAAGPTVHVVAEQQERGRRQVHAHSPQHFLEAREVRVVPVQVACRRKANKHNTYSYTFIHRVLIL